jgi:hypothetical protein
LSKKKYENKRKEENINKRRIERTRKREEDTSENYADEVGPKAMDVVAVAMTKLH